VLAVIPPVEKHRPVPKLDKNAPFKKTGYMIEKLWI